MDQITSGGSTEKELIILLLEQLRSLDSFVQKLDASLLALVEGLFESRPEFSVVYLRHLNALKNSSEIAGSDPSAQREAVYAEVIRRLKAM